MSKILNEVLLANREYTAGFDKADLAMPPARKFAILTCMDARLGGCPRIEAVARERHFESVFSII